MSVQKLMVVQCDACNYAIVSNNKGENKIEMRRLARDLGMETKVMPNGGKQDFCKMCAKQFH